jgi:DNA anti-recombination protein RmuC
MEEESQVKRIVYLCLGLSFLLMLAGCGKQEEPAQSKEKAKQAPGTTLAPETTKEYMNQQKQEYQDKAAKKMAEYRERLAALKSKAAQAQGELKAKYDKQVDDLQKKTDELQQKLKDMQSAAGKAWEDLKSKTDDAMEKLQKEYDEATSSNK